MAHHHQAKRPYAGSQPSITNYFSQSQPNTYNITPSHHQHQPPPTIQSNLLSVGMRVRKSVPEGYKTGTAYSAFALFSDPSTASPIQDPNPQAQAISPRTTRPRARELTPFCGILKVGGLAQQAWGIYNPGGHGREIEAVGLEEEEEEEEDLPFLSQGSTMSNSSVESFGYVPFTNSPSVNKRRFEEEEIDFAVRNIGGEVREIAVPRRRKGDGRVAGKVPKFAFGQENGMGVDFGDAEFLDYEGLGGGKEVEMGGV